MYETILKIYKICCKKLLPHTENYISKSPAALCALLPLAFRVPHRVCRCQPIDPVGVAADATLPRARARGGTSVIRLRWPMLLLPMYASRPVRVRGGARGALPRPQRSPLAARPLPPASQAPPRRPPPPPPKGRARTGARMHSQQRQLFVRRADMGRPELARIDRSIVRSGLVRVCADDRASAGRPAAARSTVCCWLVAVRRRLPRCSCPPLLLLLTRKRLTQRPQLDSKPDDRGKSKLRHSSVQLHLSNDAA